jgi:hypothetical protein
MPSLSALVLGIALGWAALAKVARPRVWAAALNGYRLPHGVRTVALVVVPAAEGLAAVLLVLGGDATRAGAALGVALLAGFSLAVLRARRLHGRRLPCGCFGRSGDRDYRLMLVRNSALGVVAAAVLVLPERRLGLDAPAFGEAVPVILAASGLALVALLGVTLVRMSR